MPAVIECRVCGDFIEWDDAQECPACEKEPYCEECMENHVCEEDD